MSFDEDRERTVQAFFDPSPGMRFTEMYAFWVHVVEVRDDGVVVVEEYNPPCTVPDDARRILFRNADHFRKRYAYDSIPGYWVTYVGDDAPVAHVPALRGTEGYASLWEGTPTAEWNAVSSRRSRARRAAARTSEKAT